MTVRLIFDKEYLHQLLDHVIQAVSEELLTPEEAQRLVTEELVATIRCEVEDG